MLRLLSITEYCGQLKHKIEKKKAKSKYDMKRQLKGTSTQHTTALRIQNYAAHTWQQFCFTENVIALTESLKRQWGSSKILTVSSLAWCCRDETKSLESLIKSCKTSPSASRCNNYLPWNTPTICFFLLWMLELTRIGEGHALFIKQWVPCSSLSPFPSSHPVMRAVQSGHSVLTTCWLLVEFTYNAR